MKSRLAKGNFYNNSDYAIEYKTLNAYTMTHWHNFYEFDIILSGKGKTVCNGKEFDIKRGLVSLLSPLDFHDYSCKDNVELINVQFRERDISYELLDRLTLVKDKVIFLDDSTLSDMEKLCELIRNGINGTFKEEYRKKIIECLIIFFLNSSEKNKIQKISNSGIKRAVVYLNTHFSLNPSMKETAEKFYLNPSYFSRAFKENTGMTYKEYLRNLKLQYSKTLIKYTDLSFIEIALKSGYGTQSHFNREFKEYFKMTPLEYKILKETDYVN